MPIAESEGKDKIEIKLDDSPNINILSKLVSVYLKTFCIQINVILTSRPYVLFSFHSHWQHYKEKKKRRFLYNHL